MRLIGLTGGIATGKSEVAAMLAEHGATVVDADELAREVVRPGEPALADIASRFGAGVLTPDGTLDRERLGEIVFADASARRDLEGITHARIAALMQQRIADAAAREAPVVVLDIPLLLERDLENTVDGVLLVHAPAGVQLARVASRDHLTDDAARQRLAAQLPIDEKRTRATWIIDNSSDLDSTRRQVDAWWREVIEVRPPGR
ncbi:MAG: dephospho-CoA kinase [Chloroflexi bacterium]|nr:MAG: dephospho-CoA kinase [Chloroflexota bacterium]